MRTTPLLLTLSTLMLAACSQQVAPQNDTRRAVIDFGEVRVTLPEGHTASPVERFFGEPGSLPRTGGDCVDPATNEPSRDCAFANIHTGYFGEPTLAISHGGQVMWQTTGINCEKMSQMTAAFGTKTITLRLVEDDTSRTTDAEGNPCVRNPDPLVLQTAQGCTDNAVCISAGNLRRADLEAFLAATDIE